MPGAILPALRLVRFDPERTGIVADAPEGPVVIDVTSELPEGGRDWTALIPRWPELAVTLDDQVRRAVSGHGLPRLPLERVHLRAPLPSPLSRIFAMGVNFRAHVASASAAVGQADPVKAGGSGRPPAGFFVIPGTVRGPGDEIVPPAEAQKLDYEAEVAVVLARGGRHLTPGDIQVWGYTGFNDVSIRDPHLGLSRLDEGALAWGLQKNFDGGNICGPWLLVDPLADISRIGIVSRVNGQERQRGSTEQMIHAFADGAAYLSRFLSLMPGDMLTSGTPAGTAIEQGIDGPYLQAGDLIEVEVSGAGVLRNRVASAG